MRTLLGSNVPAIGGLATAFEVADRWDCECIQIYVTPSRRWDIPDRPDAEAAAIIAARANSKVRHVVAHVPFLVNIASPDRALRERSTRRLATELLRANQVGVEDIVLHPGSYGTLSREQGIAHIVQAIKEVFRLVPDGRCRIALETMAGQGTMVGSRFEDIVEILDGVGPTERLSVCLDTCHLFAAGYNLTGYAGYEETMKQVIAKFGLERISVIHVNDSQGRRGSRTDRHASVGEGTIGYEAFHALMRDKRFIDVPKILEIPERDERSIENLRLLRAFEAIDGALTESLIGQCKGGPHATNCR